MGIFNLFSKKKKSEQKGITAPRYKGRWYGLMFCLGEESGRDMREATKDKASEILTMLKISNEFPDDFKYVNKLIELEKAREEQSKQLTDSQRQAEYLIGAVEAKKVYNESLETYDYSEPGTPVKVKEDNAVQKVK